MLLAIDILLALLTVFAGPYRVIAFKFRSFGGIGSGLVTWIGIAVAFPVCIAMFSPAGSWWLVAWLALIVCAYIQMFVKWCSTSPGLDPASPHCWFATGEIVVVTGLVFAAQAASGPGGIVFVLIGYVCSTADWLLRRLRRRCQAWTPRHSKRLLAQLRRVRARARAQVTKASPVCLYVLRRSWLVLGVVLRWFWRLLTGRGKQPGPAQEPYYGRPHGWGRRLATFFVGHAILSLLGFSIFLKIMAVPLAIFLSALGWHVGMPEQMKEQGLEIIEHGREWLGVEKDELTEWARDKGEQFGERFRGKRQVIEQQLKDTFEREKQQFGEAVARRRNAELRRYLFQ